VVGRAHGAGTCREAASFNEAVDVLTHQPATCLALIDIDLPGMASDLGLRFFATHYRQTGIVALLSLPADDRVDRLEAAGLAGCISKDLSERSLADAIDTILKGGRYRPPVSALPIGRAPATREAPPDFVDHDLTERQGEVLRLLALGRSNREIGQLLNIAEGTVKVHVNAAFRVLGVHNRVSAAAALRKRFDEPQLEHEPHVEG